MRRTRHLFCRPGRCPLFFLAFFGPTCFGKLAGGVSVVGPVGTATVTFAHERRGTASSPRKGGWRDWAGKSRPSTSRPSRRALMTPPMWVISCRWRAPIASANSSRVSPAVLSPQVGGTGTLFTTTSSERFLTAVSPLSGSG
jgi:hypothetical protein